MSAQIAASSGCIGSLSQARNHWNLHLRSASHPYSSLWKSCRSWCWTVSARYFKHWKVLQPRACARVVDEARWEFDLNAVGPRQRPLSGSCYTSSCTWGHSSVIIASLYASPALIKPSYSWWFCSALQLFSISLHDGRRIAFWLHWGLPSRYEFSVTSARNADWCGPVGCAEQQLCVIRT